MIKDCWGAPDAPASHLLILYKVGEVTSPSYIKPRIAELGIIPVFDLWPVFYQCALGPFQFDPVWDQGKSGCRS